MKERPMLFNAPMVRAILDGRKTQTRRVVKRCGLYESTGGQGMRPMPEACPYGVPGDRLWVRETFQRFSDDGEILYKADPASFEEMNELKRDECLEASWRPSIHMPRWASRITLEVVSVKVERLQDISNEDALAEGIKAIPHGREGTFYHHERTEPHLNNWCAPDDAFRELWESINGAGSWDENPWVWAITFKRVTP